MELDCLIVGKGGESDLFEGSVKFSADVEVEPLSCRHGTIPQAGWPSVLLLPPK